MNKVFLGGICVETTWRKDLIDCIQVDYFNPVVESWTPECQEIEEVQKRDKCNIHLYVITKEMQSVFSIAEVIESVHMTNKQTILHIIPNGFNKVQLKHLGAVLNMVKKHGGIGYIDDDLMRTARVINYCFK